MKTDRVIRCIEAPHCEYITAGQDYHFGIHDGTVHYTRVVGNSGSTMRESVFKRCLAEGLIVFVDNLKEAK
jgi:hypothetical protein